MSQPTKHDQSQPKPFPGNEVSEQHQQNEQKQQQQQAEQNEVAGRHKNDGQKDHKGAR